MDINIFPEAAKFVETHQLAQFTGKHKKSGFVNYPLYIFDLDKLENM